MPDFLPYMIFFVMSIAYDTIQKSKEANKLKEDKEICSEAQYVDKDECGSRLS